MNQVQGDDLRRKPALAILFPDNRVVGEAVGALLGKEGELLGKEIILMLAIIRISFFP